MSRVRSDRRLISSDVGLALPLEAPFWARVTDTDGAGAYAWEEVAPTLAGDWETELFPGTSDPIYRVGTLTLDAAYEASGNIAVPADGSVVVLMRRGAIDPTAGYDCRFEYPAGTSTTYPTGTTVTYASGSTITMAGPTWRVTANTTLTLSAGVTLVYAGGGTSVYAFGVGGSFTTGPTVLFKQDTAVTFNGLLVLCGPLFYCWATLFPVSGTITQLNPPATTSKLPLVTTNPGTVIKGIDVTSGGAYPASTRELTLFNDLTSTDPFTVKHMDSGAASVDRVYIPLLTDLIVKVGESLDLLYDTVQGIFWAVGGSALQPTLDIVRAPVANVSLAGYRVVNAADPVSAQDAATKNYVDSVATGFRILSPCLAATTGTLPACTYANGTLGVGATLTGNSNGALAAQDGATLVANDRLLVKNQASGAQNGPYTLTTVGDGSHPFVLTRATDADQAAELASGAATFISSGTVNGGSVWVQTTTGAITVGTTALVWTQFSGATTYSNGTGLSLTGTQFAVLYGTTAGTACQGNDARLSDARTPVGTALTSGKIWVGSGSNLAAAVTPSGAWTIDNAGVATLGTVAATKGGTGLTSYTLGDVLYASAANTLSALPGNTAAAIKFLTQLGTGSASAAPSWRSIFNSDLPDSGVSAGNYASVSVNAKGVVLSGSGVLTVAMGGVGLSVYAVGDILYASATNVLSRVAGNTLGLKMFLSQTGSGGVAGAPAWGLLSAGDIPDLDMSQITSGTLAAARGGTGNSSYTVGDMLAATGSTALGKVTPNATTARMFLSQIGSGSAAFSPGWRQPDITELATSFTDGYLPMANAGVFTTLPSTKYAAGVFDLGGDGRYGTGTPAVFDIRLAGGQNLVFDTTGGGTKIGTAANQLLALWGGTPAARLTPSGVTSGFTANSGTAMNSASTSTGGTGSTAVTFGDVVKALKSLGVIPA